jgi:hypothetical protein
MTIDMGPVISAVQSYGDARAAESEKAAHDEDAAQIDALTAQVADLQARLAAFQPPARFPGDPGAGKVYWGSSQDGSDIKDWTDFSASCGGLGVCRRYYQSTDLAKFSTETDALKAVGALNAASFKVPGNDWAGVGAGKYDTWLGQVRDAVKAAGVPVFLCLHHEPNGNGTPADFKAMYAHAAPILKQADNLVLMPIHNGWLFVDDNGWQQWMVPEADVNGIDIYPRKMADKAELVAKYQKGLDNLASGGKPMFLAEYGARDLVQGDYAAQMIRDLYDYLIERGDVVGVSYFNSSKNVNVFPEAGPYWLAGDRLAAFVECGKRATSVRYAPAS